LFSARSPSSWSAHMPPNHAFNRTRRHGPSTWQASVAAGRLAWSYQASRARS
jgi:hypothetical protein